MYIIRIGIVHYCSRATQVVDDNDMKNVMSLTTRVASMWSKVISISCLVKLMISALVYIPIIRVHCNDSLSFIVIL